MSNQDRLTEIFEDDELGLLDVEPKESSTQTEEDRLIQKFQEINEFVAKNGREPKEDGGILEFQLSARLKNIKENQHKIQVLKEFDKHDLLPLDQVEAIESIDDIFENDDMDLLNIAAEDNIYNLKHVSKETNMPEYVAHRKKCQDFEEFKPLFEQCHKAIETGKRKLKPFAREQHIKKGHFFVLKGVLLYVAEVGEKMQNEGKKNARLRCIFENGTESDMLLRSLAAELYKDGRRVTAHKDNYLENFQNISEEDEEVGFIYVLESKSRKPQIKQYDNLYKVGFTKKPVEERIKNAKHEPTFLMAPVLVVAEFKCYNMNPQTFESLIHRFFGEVCLETKVYDNEGNRHNPREWFIAPYTVIEDAIGYIITGEIVNYKYDPERKRIVGR